MESNAGMQSLLNIQKSVTIIHNINRVKKKNHVIISVDAGKVF